MRRTPRPCRRAGSSSPVISFSNTDVAIFARLGRDGPDRVDNRRNCFGEPPEGAEEAQEDQQTADVAQQCPGSHRGGLRPSRGSSGRWRRPRPIARLARRSCAADPSTTKRPGGLNQSRYAPRPLAASALDPVHRAEQAKNLPKGDNARRSMKHNDDETIQLRVGRETRDLDLARREGSRRPRLRPTRNSTIARMRWIGAGEGHIRRFDSP